MLGPILQGEKIGLHPLRREDIPLFCDWQADLEVFHFLAPLHGPSTQRQMEEDFEEIAKSDRLIGWRIDRDGQTIGNTFLAGIDWMNRQAEGTLMIGDKSAWGHGYATEAVRLRTRYAFEDIGLERLESSSVAENIGMHRALERSGYQKVGRRRHCFFRAGVWHDRFILEVLRDEWRAEFSSVDSTPKSS